ncbi:hypothetical protein SCLCIDRAFT_1103949 [Scleroderma citrinum Foug A]|uniref:Uncharacterized protein n=1 Tax=Scleroderma citrinum Foug A TaxID=1036808 RepID=A0A0C3DBA4_9AGAM|nr:hypothetical protein SCLCIDRAFT_1103949 [Scleroderma citrinum Foug A]
MASIASCCATCRCSHSTHLAFIAFSHRVQFLWLWSLFITKLMGQPSLPKTEVAISLPRAGVIEGGLSPCHVHSSPVVSPDADFTLSYIYSSLFELSISVRRSCPWILPVPQKRGLRRYKVMLNAYKNVRKLSTSIEGDNWESRTPSSSCEKPSLLHRLSDQEGLNCPWSLRQYVDRSAMLGAHARSLESSSQTLSGTCSGRE